MDKWANKEKFKARVKEFAQKMDIAVRSISIRPMKNKWASCSTDGNLNFNSELLEMEKEIGEYVIVHELLHFKVPNHGKLWKSLMTAYLGDYEKKELKLKKIAGNEAMKKLLLKNPLP